MRVELVAVHRRKTGVFQYGGAVQSKCGGNAGAHKLQKEGLAGGSGNRAVIHHPRRASADHEGIANIFLKSGHNGRRTVVHRDGDMRPAAQRLVPGNIALRDRRLKHCHVRVFPDAGQIGAGMRDIQEHGVEVEFQLEIRRQAAFEYAALLVEIEPRAGFGLECGVALGLRLPALQHPIVGRHVDGPPAHERTLAAEAAEQPVYGHITGFGHRVKQGHLQSAAERIVPHQLCGVMAGSSLDRGIRHPAPGIVDHRFAESHHAAGKRYFRDLEDRPVGEFANHVAGWNFAERKVDPSALDLLHREVEPGGCCSTCGDRRGRKRGRHADEVPVCRHFSSSRTIW